MRCLAAVVIAFVSTAPAVAHAGVEFGGVGGLHTFSENSDLGVPKNMAGDPQPTATSLKNSAFFGFRIGVYFNLNLGVEAEGGGIPTEPRSILFDVWAVAARAQVVYQIHADRPGNVLIPFLMAGAGVIDIVDVGPSSNENIVKKDLKIEPYVGIGAKYRTGAGWGVRGDARIGYMSSSPGAGVALETEVLLGLYKEFGRAAVKKKAEPVQPPKDDDADHDGITGAADKCPTEAEDKDGFEDDDGCPDLDNDKDGILDKDDKCPTDAEDKDGFEDTDGCPDLDNDQDGVADKDDKCNDKPETRNGFEDTDGCPDELPETLKKLVGVVNVNYKANVADLAPGANAALDKIVATLNEVKDVKIEVGVHTDDVALKAGGKFADNAALSQARADAVKAYFVSKGIEESRIVSKGYADTAPVEDPKGLTGGKLNAARTKNRRTEIKLVVAELPAPATQTPPAPKQ